MEYQNEFYQQLPHSFVYLDRIPTLHFNLWPYNLVFLYIKNQSRYNQLAHLRPDELENVISSESSIRL